MQGAAGPNVHIHDTHFVVGHFHFVMFGGTGFAFLAGLHFWWPKLFGRMYDFKKAYVGAALLTTGFVMNYFPMFILGMQGMPRRYYTYLPELRPLNFFAGIGAYIMLSGLALIFFNLFRSFRGARKAADDPWGATTLEWRTSSPPPLENFVAEPEISAYPYDFPELARKKAAGV